MRRLVAVAVLVAFTLLFASPKPEKKKTTSVVVKNYRSYVCPYEKKTIIVFQIGDHYYDNCSDDGSIIHSYRCFCQEDLQ